ncbi:MAG: ABC transporter permease subunit [Clostridia bacterium]
MENSTIKIKKIGVVLFWLFVWQIIALLLGKPLLLPTVPAVFLRLLELIWTKSFWLITITSFSRISLGFLCALLIGLLGGFFTYRWISVRILFTPVLQVMRATPLASFIILALIWLKSGILPSFIAGFSILPIIWLSVQTGLEQMSIPYGEMAKVFGLNWQKKLRFIYAPQVKPYFLSACITAVGFAWKAGVTAELLSLPQFGIGTELYSGKIYLETVDLFVWTLVLIIISVALERMVKKWLSKN